MSKKEKEIRLAVVMLLIFVLFLPNEVEAGEHVCPANRLNFRHNGINVTELVEARNWADIDETRLWRFEGYTEPLNRTGCWGACPFVQRVLNIVIFIF